MTGNPAIKGAIIGAFVRLLLLVLMLAMQASPGEGAQSFLLDLPTIGIYLLIGIVGVHLHIADAADPIFHIVGIAVWTLLGLTAGFFVGRIRVRRMPTQRR